jgi:hypothetical protein
LATARRLLLMPPMLMRDVRLFVLGHICLIAIAAFSLV